MARHTRFGGRTLARSQALQLLFQAEATGRMVVDVLAGEYALSDGPLESFGEQLAVGADSMLDDLDAVMEMTSSNWGVSRMNAVDRNLLRLAIYEMLKVDDVDVAVTIDECVVLAKAYGTDESSRFVNGLLGRVATLMDEGVDVVALAHERLGHEMPAVEEKPAAESAAEEELAEPESPVMDEVESVVEEEPVVEEAPQVTEASAADVQPEEFEVPQIDDDLPDWARED